jgi:hypothetical protein
MLRKIALGIAFAAALMMPLSAFAARGHGGGHGGGRGHVGGRGHSVGHVGGHGHAHMRRGTVRGHAHVHAGRGRGHGHGHYSHRRHFWHGRWWAYGVGTCWTYDPTYDEYYWVCGDGE